MKKLLILGGTRFFGPALIRSLRLCPETYDITCFHRGLHMDAAAAAGIRPFCCGRLRKGRDLMTAGTTFNSIRFPGLT